MHHFLRHPYFQELLSLQFASDDFAIAGSGPLYARGLIDEIGDVDVVARGSVWQKATQLGVPQEAPYYGVHVVRLFDGDIEVLDGWLPEVWTVDQVIDKADVIEGLRFASLDVTLKTKQILQAFDRPVDREHIKIIEEYLGQGTGR